MKCRTALVETIAGRKVASPIAVRRPRTLSAHFFALIAALVLVVAANSARAAAPPIWELRPYRILVLVVPDSSPVWTDDRLDALRESIPPRAGALFGAAWEVETTLAGSAVRRTVWSDVWSDVSDSSAPRAPSPQALAVEVSDAGQYDKLMVLSLAATPVGFAVAAQEYDTATGLWGEPATRRTTEANRIGGEAFIALATAFQPLAQVRLGEGGAATVRVRAIGLPPRDRRLTPAQVGSVFRLVRARSGGDPDGSAPPADRTSSSFVVVDEVNETGATGSVYTPLGWAAGTSSAQDTWLALGVVASHPGTEVELVQTGATAEPLAGFELTARPVDRQDDTIRLGRTDRRGRLHVAARGTHLWTLDVVVGGQTIARTLMVPGWQEHLIWELPIDERRMAALSAIDSLHADLVSSVLRREVALARIKSRLAAEETERARELIDELRRDLQSERGALTQRVERARREAAAGGEPVASTAALWDRLRGQLASEFDPARVDEALAAAGGDDIPPAGWQRYASVEGGFAVLFPGEPAEDKNTVDTPVGPIAYSAVSLTAQEGESTKTYAVSYEEIPEQMQELPANELLTQTFQTFATVKGFQVEQTTPIDLGGTAGVELTAAMGELRARVRVFVAEKRSYQVLVSGTQEQVDSDDAKRFLDSFQFTP